MIVFSESFDAFKQTSNSFLQSLNRFKTCYRKRSKGERVRKMERKMG
jgi:hypothetical protein